LLAFGVWRVREVFPPNTPPLYLLPFGGGYLTRRGAARVIVATHHSFLDAFFVGSRLIPTAVAKAALASVPILGAAMASLGPVLVPRSAEEKQRLPPVLDQIVAKATSLHPIYQPLVVFPEGTTSSCATILSFQIGAFVPGVPVQPLLLHYSCGAGSTLARLLSLVGVRVPPSAHGVDPAMTPDLSSVTSLLRLLLLPSVTLTATYLPVVRPTEAERADPGLYAARVRQAMVLASGRVPVDASDRDALLFSRCSAPERGGRPCSDWVLNTLIRPVGAKEIERLLGTPLRLDVTTCLAVRLWEAAAGQEGSEGAGESESAPDAAADSVSEAAFARLLDRHLAPFVLRAKEMARRSRGAAGTAAASSISAEADTAGPGLELLLRVPPRTAATTTNAHAADRRRAAPIPPVPASMEGSLLPWSAPLLQPLTAADITACSDPRVGRTGLSAFSPEPTPLPSHYAGGVFLALVAAARGEAAGHTRALLTPREVVLALALVRGGRDGGGTGEPVATGCRRRRPSHGILSHAHPPASAPPPGNRPRRERPRAGACGGLGGLCGGRPLPTDLRRTPVPTAHPGPVRGHGVGHGDGRRGGPTHGPPPAVAGGAEARGAGRGGAECGPPHRRLPAPCLPAGGQHGRGRRLHWRQRE
jgi:1-acyl-sn-glycerol-3-phosphate acyltransferase